MHRESEITWAETGEDFRRNAPRFDLPTDSGIYVTSDEHGWLGPVRNIGCGGMFVECTTSIGVGAKLHLHLAISSQNVMHSIVGHVCYVLPSGMGIEFIGIDPTAEHDIQHMFEMSTGQTADAQMAASVHLSALLLSPDAETAQLAREVFRAAGIKLDECVEAPSAAAKLARNKFETMVLDWRLQGEAGRVLGALRSSASNYAAVVIALTHNDEQAHTAREQGANFVLPAPFSLSTLSKVVQAGYGLMLRELRRYFRCPIDLSVDLQRASGEACLAHALNVSERGMALSAPRRLIAGETVFVAFVLPGVRNRLRAVGPICWADDRGKAGLQFQEMGRDARVRLQQWLAAKLEATCVPAALQIKGTRTVPTMLSRRQSK